MICIKFNVSDKVRAATKTSKNDDDLVNKMEAPLESRSVEGKGMEPQSRSTGTRLSLHCRQTLRKLKQQRLEKGWKRLIKEWRTFYATSPVYGPILTIVTVKTALICNIICYKFPCFRYDYNYDQNA